MIMHKTKKVSLCGILGLIAAVGIGLIQHNSAVAQENRAAQWRQRNLARVKEQLGVTDEEWQTIKPLVEKVQTLSQQTRLGRRRGRRGAAEGDATQQSELEMARQALQTLLNDQNATDKDIEIKLAALRDAVEKAKKEVAEAQKELQKAVNLRQEAQLVLQGVLE